MNITNFLTLSFFHCCYFSISLPFPLFCLHFFLFLFCHKKGGGRGGDKGENNEKWEMVKKLGAELVVFLLILYLGDHFVPLVPPRHHQCFRALFWLGECPLLCHCAYTGRTRIGVNIYSLNYPPKLMIKCV